MGVIAMAWLQHDHPVDSDAPPLSEVSLYKGAKDSKLGVTFFRHTPDGALANDVAVISRVDPRGIAGGKLVMGER